MHQALYGDMKYANEENKGPCPHRAWGAVGMGWRQHIDQ